MDVKHQPLNAMLFRNLLPYHVIESVPSNHPTGPECAEEVRTGQGRTGRSDRSAGRTSARRSSWPGALPFRGPIRPRLDFKR